MENYGWLLPAPFLGGYNWMTPYMVDIDEDGDYDLFSGEVTGKISFLRNDGTPNMADFNYITNCFDSIQINPQYGGFTSICFYDIDADNDLDMFVSGFFPPPALNSGILFYRNIGNTQNYNFILEDSAFAGIAYISPIYPDFCDIDADGDYDLFMGHSETQYYRNISFYLNTGTPQEPQMELVTHNFASIEEDGIAHPRFCDIDDDGDFDLFVGVGTNFGLGSPYSNGKISFYENIGTPEVYDFDLISTFYDSIYVQDEASPCFADIDNDGDYDLFVGKGDDTAYFAVGSMGGDLVFYQNNGTAA
ncbi:MAG: VCBS repeat-containing protein, partial [FCB group bacterium]|nr:VCBS repeat-containing protein [FCB group bacterium]